jgi:hypothetical protein
MTMLLIIEGLLFVAGFKKLEIDYHLLVTG